MSTTRPICSIIVFVCLLAISNFSYGDCCCWDEISEWNPVGSDCNWNNPDNWSPPGVPGPCYFVAVLPSQPGPCITGNAQCSMLSLNPWDPTSWGGRDTIVTITETALNVNFGAAIQINSWADYDSYLGTSALVNRAIVNVYGGTVTTPNPANADTLCGIRIGGGASTYGNSYGILNMYGGLVSVPRIAIYYGDVNLYGGTLECPPALISPLECIVLRQDRPENRINVNGGTLKLKGNHTAELSTYITNGRIVCIRGGELGTPVYDGTWTTLSGTVNFNLAWGPQPANNATNVHYKIPDGNSITLGWQPGDLAKQHDVYFGTSFTDVNSATTASAEYKGSRYDANGDPHNWTITGSFNMGYNYYWRIDETNDGGIIAKGLVWKFTTHDGKAYNPKPVNAGSGLSEPLQLSWTPGDWAGIHRVFFGTTAPSVTNASTSSTDGRYRGTVSSPVYPLSRLLENGPTPPGGSWTLQAGTTYYWRIDEVNNTTVYKGNVWSFTPAGYINIDDFEDYNSTNELNANWLTGYEIAACGGGVTGEAELAFVRDADGKHMQYTYTNGGGGVMAFSEAKRPYSGGTSFTGSGVISPALTKLRIDYRGTAVNAADPIYDRMYVAIEDTAGNVSVYLNPDHAAQQVSDWTSWYTSLTDINATGNTNLNAITGFAIGFGQRCNNYDFGGGDGNVMFDNIRLYARTCNPLYRPKADFDGDCDVDFEDLAILAENWLTPCMAWLCGDLSNDGFFIDFKDFAILANEWRTDGLRYPWE